VLDGLALPAGRWEVRRSDFVTRQLPDPDGKPATRPDNVLTVGRVDPEATRRRLGGNEDD